jgi:predicted deacetylase
MQKIILEWDDLNPHPEVDCLEVIEKLVSRYPNIILNFFTIPIYKETSLSSYPKWCDRIRQLIELGNVNLACHSTYHTNEEFKNVSYGEAFAKLQKSEEVFREAKLPFNKVFRGAHWGLNKNTMAALINRGYTHLYSHTDYQLLTNQFANQIKVVYYNYNFKDIWPHLENELVDSDIIVCHGHTSIHDHLNCGNGIAQSYEKICNIIECGKDITLLKVQDY